MWMHAFLEALVTVSAAPEIPARSDLYAPLLGSWSVDVVDYGAGGTPEHSHGEWHFARTLGGRAVQDVWVAPPRRYGSTTRVYDRARDEWRITWINPVSGVETRLVGRRDGDRLVHLGRDADGTLLRWTFSDLGATSFVWRGEDSRDDGKTWRLGAEFFARRLEAPAHGREVLWVSPDTHRFEQLRLGLGSDGFSAEGLIVRAEAGHDVRARYRIAGDASWRVRSLRVESLDGARALALVSDGHGHWRDERGAPVEALAGCVDVDLSASPFTNTIPIRRLALAVGAAAEIKVAFVSIPELAVTPARQRYTRLAADRYRYEGLDSAFTTELPVDSDALLIEYPGYFRRAAAHSY